VSRSRPHPNPTAAEEDAARTWEHSWVIGDPSYPSAAREEIRRLRQALARADGEKTPLKRVKAAIAAMETADPLVLFDEDLPKIGRLASRLRSMRGSTYKQPIPHAVFKEIDHARKELMKLEIRYHRQAEDFIHRPAIDRYVFASGFIPLRAKIEVMGRVTATLIAEEYAEDPNLSPEARDRAAWLMDADATDYTGLRSSAPAQLRGVTRGVFARGLQDV
jgi:phage terminase Nu1 subunit (DNA packaging protein)